MTLPTYLYTLWAIIGAAVLYWGAGWALAWIGDRWQR